MKAATFLPLLVLLLFSSPDVFAAGASTSPDMKPLPVGQAFPDITFTGPVTDKEAKELGAGAGGKPFTLQQTKTQAVILVVFSMYCPFCQKEAPELNTMNTLIKSKGLSDKIRLVGLGAGNSPFEVNLFREKFSIPFPLIPDQDFAAYKMLGQVGTPFYYVLKRQGAGFVIVDTQLGCVTSAEAFLKAALEKTGLNKEK
ncbi:MAG: peroxiredoxin family protein [Acidobacteriota bacterium]